MQEYKEAKGQILNLYNRVTKEISEEIDVILSPSEEQYLSTSRSVNPDAYEAYLRGMSYWELGKKEDLDRAMEYFELARNIDPEYALGHFGIARAWAGYAQHGFISAEEARIKSEAFFKRALELDSTLVEIHTGMAISNTWFKWQWDQAGSAYRRAIDLNPSYAFAHAYYSQYLGIMGDPEKGLPHGELAMQLDPLNSLYQSVHGQALKNARKYDEALQLLLKMVEFEPDQGIGLPALWAVYHEMAQYDKALETAKKIYELKGNNDAITAIEEGYQAGGYQKAIQNVAEMMIKKSSNTYIPPWQICTLYCRAEMKEEALAYLQQAFEGHDPNMPYISIDPLFDFLRGEERFKKILDEMGLPEFEATG